MKKDYMSLFRNIICILFILIISIAAIVPCLSNDLFFDLKTGQSILKYGIDFKDHFSFIPNLTYIYHHWLYDLIIYGIYKVFSFDGVFFLFLSIFSIFGICVFFVNKTRSNRFISLIVALYTLYASAYAFQVRVQSITYLLFFLEVYFLEKLYKTGNKKYSAFLILLSILIVNLHMPIWIFYLILCLPYLVEGLFSLLSRKNKLFKNVFNIEESKNIKVFLITLLILLFTGFISPLKLYPYTFFTKSLFNDSFLFIGEMAKTALYYYAFEPLLIVFILISAYLKIIKFSFRDFLLIMGLFIFSLIASRNVAFFLIIVPTIYVKSINLNYKFNNKKITSILRKINFKYVCMSTIVFLIGIYSFLCFNFYNTRDDYGVENEFPDKIVNYIKNNLDYKNIKLYTDFNYGSYPAFYDIPVFVDSRAEVYIKEFNGGKDIITDYHDSKKINKYKEVFQKYNFDAAIVYFDSQLYYYLSNDSDYELAYQEDDSTKYSLFLKK